MENVDELNVTNVTVTPATSKGKKKNAKDELKKEVQETAQAVKESLDSFSDTVDENPEAQKARGFLRDFTSFIKSEGFKNEVNETAKKYNLPPKKIAESFFEKALGTVGDVLGVVFNTAGNAGHMLIDILATIAHGAVNLIVNVASALARVFTLNKTCIA